MKKLVALCALLPSSALAHADHTHQALSAEHMMHSPFHIAATLAAVIGVALVARFLWREARQERAHGGRK